MKAVLSLGGSVINDGQVHTQFLKEMKRLNQEDIAIVTGGGNTARFYIDAARELGLTEYQCDEIGIAATYINARLVAHVLGWPVVKDIEEGRIYGARFVMGGMLPGFTTDTDAVLLAEAMDAPRMVNITKTGAVYDRDPSLNGARSLAYLSYGKMEELAFQGDQRKAGTHFPVDLVAVRLAKRSSIEIHVVPPDIDAILRAINGKSHEGTVIGRHRPTG